MISSASMSATGVHGLAVERDRHALAEADAVPGRRASAWRRRSGDSTHASSGMDSFESSVSRPPMVTPHRPRLME
jgi:hypothetical protein